MESMESRLFRDAIAGREIQRIPHTEEERRKKVLDALAYLRNRSRRVLEMLYGVGGKKLFDPEEVARILLEPVEKVRRIKVTALRQLREILESEDG